MILEKLFFEDRLKSSLIKINPDIPTKTVNNATSQIVNSNTPGLLQSNREMHKLDDKRIKSTFY